MRGQARWCGAALSAWALSACTLTTDPFEPNPVERVGTELAPFDADEPPAPAGNGDLPPEQTGGEAAPEPTRLEPASAEGAAAPVNGAADADALAPGEAGGADAGAVPVEATAPEAPGPEALGPEALPAPPAACSRSFASSCYEVFGEPVSWEVAEQRCVAWGGHLASVDSPAEDAFLDDWPQDLGLATADGSGVWLGGTDLGSDGDFRWLDGNVVSTDAWAPTQPDNGAGQDCIEKRNDGAGLWYDLRCSDLLGYVCERAL